MDNQNIKSIVNNNQLVASIPEYTFNNREGTVVPGSAGSLAGKSIEFSKSNKQCQQNQRTISPKSLIGKNSINNKGLNLSSENFTQQNIHNQQFITDFQGQDEQFTQDNVNNSLSKNLNMSEVYIGKVGFQNQTYEKDNNNFNSINNGPFQNNINRCYVPTYVSFTRMI